MLIQYRRDGRLRLFRQHDHALAAGALAAAWRGLDRDPEALPFEVVLATSLHDLAWRGLDSTPVVDPAEGRPLAFHEHPFLDRLAAYRSGLDEVEAIHPYAGLLGSLHYAYFVDGEREGRAGAEREEAVAFLEAEEERRRRLTERLGLGLEEQAGARRHVRWLRMFDALSLFLCLTPPPADDGRRPGWIERARHPETPEGDIFHLTWRDEEVVHVDPFPFGHAVELRLPYRELPASPPRDRETWCREWEAAPATVWWISLRPSPRLA